MHLDGVSGIKIGLKQMSGNGHPHCYKLYMELPAGRIYAELNVGSFSRKTSPIKRLRFSHRFHF